MIEIHLFGKLRQAVPNLKAGGKAVIEISPLPDDTIASILERAGIDTDRIYSLFFNHKLLAARSRMALWLRYRQLCANPLDWDLNVPVKSGDRIGLFGRDMAALVV